MKSIASVVALTLVLAAARRPAPLAAQQFTMSGAEGIVLVLPGGRMAILQPVDGVLTVKNLIDGESGAAPLDIAEGDRVVSFQGQQHPSAELVSAGFDRLAAGTEVVLGLVRGTAAPHQVRFPKPAVAAGRRMAVSSGAGAGAWVTGGGAGSSGMVIAGAAIRENDQGMPEVTHRGSDPAAATVALRVGDVITAVNGRTIAALRGLEQIYGALAPGDRVELTVTRDGRPTTVAFAKPGN